MGQNRPEILTVSVKREKKFPDLFQARVPIPCGSKKVNMEQKKTHRAEKDLPRFPGGGAILARGEDTNFTGEIVPHDRKPGRIKKGTKNLPRPKTLRIEHIKRKKRPGPQKLWGGGVCCF